MHPLFQSQHFFQERLTRPQQASSLQSSVSAPDNILLFETPAPTKSPAARLRHGSKQDCPLEAHSVMSLSRRAPSSCPLWPQTTSFLKSSGPRKAPAHLRPKPPPALPSASATPGVAGQHRPPVHKPPPSPPAEAAPLARSTTRSIR
jgi:hypothetical protein